MVILSSINNENINEITNENNDPRWLIEMRTDAFSKYTSLPSEVSPLYKKYSDVNRLKPECIYLPDRYVKSEPSKELVDRLKELEQGTGVLQIGSSTNQLYIPDKISKQGLIILDIKDALRNYEDLSRNS